jgi:hypothetical protein
MNNTGKAYPGIVPTSSPVPVITPLKTRRKIRVCRNTGKHPFTRNIFNVFNEINTGKTLPPTGGNIVYPYSPQRGFFGSSSITGGRKEMNATKKELASSLGVSQRTITLWQNAGMPVLEKAGRGGKNRYCTDAVAEWLEKRKAPTQEPPKDQQAAPKPRRDAWGGKY